MDRLKKGLALMIVLLLVSCIKTGKVDFIYWDMSKEYSLNELSAFLYAQPDIYKHLSNKNIEILDENDLGQSDFLISKKDKVNLKLDNKYDSIEKCLQPLDCKIKRFLIENFGILKPDISLQDSIYIYENNAFFELVDTSNIYAFTVELISNKQIELGIAYIIME